METVALSKAIKQYTLDQVNTMIDEVWADAKQRLHREIEQNIDARAEQVALAQIRVLARTRGMVNVRLER